MFGNTEPSLFRIAAQARGRAGMRPWSLADWLSFRREPRSAASAAPGPSSAGLATGTGEAYSQETFHYLLALEEQRFERARRPFALALVAHRPPAAPGLIEPLVAAQVFSGLAGSLRETDVIGWYDEGRVVGAILMPLGKLSEADASRQVSERITSVLRRHAPAFPHRVDVRLYRGTKDVEQ